MFKRISSLLIAVILLSSIILVVSAQTVSFIADGAGLFYSGELAELEEKAASLTSDFGIDVVIVTADSLNGINAQDYADNYYDSQREKRAFAAPRQRQWWPRPCCTNGRSLCWQVPAAAVPFSSVAVP